MKDDDWDVLLDRIEAGACTPFLGAGACHPYIETGEVIAQKWAREKAFPLSDASNLGRVAQYMALNLDGELKGDPRIPKQKMVDYLKRRNRPPFDDPKDLHATLATLPLPIYVTTNYDRFLTDALKLARRDVYRDFCRWNKWLEKRHKPERHSPTVAAPMVFHLHGHDEVVDSLVLTEDDYIDFIVNVSQRSELIPPVVQEAMTDNMLVFLGYSLSDWNFRVLFRTMQNYLEQSTRRGHVAVQLPPDELPDPARAIKFFEKYFGGEEITLFWGTCEDFAKTLREKRAARLVASATTP